MATLLKAVGLGASDPTTLGSNAANSNLVGVGFNIRCVCVQAGDVDALRLRTGPTNSGTKRAAMYADNAGTIANAARLSADIGWAFVANSVVSIPVGPVIAVTLGTFYWLSFLSPTGGGTLDYTDFTAHPDGGTTMDSGNDGAALGTPHTNLGLTSFTNIFNAWAEGVASSAAMDPLVPADSFEPARIGPF